MTNTRGHDSSQAERSKCVTDGEICSRVGIHVVERPQQGLGSEDARDDAQRSPHSPE